MYQKVMILGHLGRDPAMFTVRKVGVTLTTSFGETVVRRNDPSDPDQRP